MMPAEVPPFWAVYFSVVDTDDAVARVAELGGAVIMPADGHRARSASRWSPTRRRGLQRDHDPPVTAAGSIPQERARRGAGWRRPRGARRAPTS